MKSLSVVLVVVTSLVTGCGDDGACADCTNAVVNVETVSASACRVDECPPPDDSGEEGPVQTGYPAMGRTLYLELWNADDNDRICQYSYRYSDLSGAEVSGNVVAGEIVAANGWRFGSVYVLYGKDVTLTANCRHPGWPEIDIRASTTITTLPMTVNRTCRAIYDETYDPTMAIPCW